MLEQRVSELYRWRLRGLFALPICSRVYTLFLHEAFLTLKITSLNFTISLLYL